MSSDDYLPRVLEDDYQLEIPVPSDASKWAAVHDVLENTRSNRVGSRSGTGSLFTVAWVLGLTLGFVWMWRNGRTVFQQWQENLHRRANRRRHGIPDDDDRPFNVAYAAAALARKQREEQQQSAKSKPHSLQSGSGLERDVDSVGLRQRPLLADAALATGLASSSHNMQPALSQGNLSQGGEFVARSSTHPTSQAPALEPYDQYDPYNPNRGPILKQHDAQPAAQGLQTGSSSANANIHRLETSQGDHLLPERRKHHHVDDDDEHDEDRTSKRTRVDGEEFIDGDNDAPWMPGGSRRPSLQVPKRGAKRQANHEDEGDWEMSQDKRARKGSLAIPESDAGDDDDVDMDHESSDAELQPTRGTKRERDEPDSVADAENPDELHRAQPSYKRRANGRGRADEPSSRSRKRDRSPERSSSSDEEGHESDTQAVRHKRGRRHKEQEAAEMSSGDASESDNIASFTEDPAYGGRRIGEIWEVNGQSFKVGLDGRRLRHALVKQQRNKFPMPKDSAHNDARTNVDVVVEKWLNDEEYKAAKDKFELAWQDASPVSTPIKAEATEDDDHPSYAGKRLLWGGPPPSPVKGRASITSLSGILNPFDLAPSNVGRRVASAHLLLNNPGESPKLRSSKSFSKWEKQDMEANSLKKMRARLEKEKKEKEKDKEQQKEKETDKEKAKSCLPVAPASTPLAPTTNKPTQETKSTPSPVTAATGETKTATPAAPSLFAKPASGSPAGSIPNFFAKPASAAPGSTTQRSTTSLFPTSTQTAISSPATTAPTAPKQPFTLGPPPASASTPSESNKDTASKTSFSFAPASSAASSASGTTGASKPSFSFGTPAQTSTSDAAKPPTFNFASPQTSSTTSSDQGKPVSPFAKPASQPASSPSFAPTGNSPFSFNQPSQPQQTPTQKKPAFQFGVSSFPQSNNLGTPSGANPSSGSLLNRLGPAPASSEPSKTATTAQNAWSSPFAGASSATSTNTLNTNPSSTNIFGQAQSQPQQGTSSLSESAHKPSPFMPSGPPKSVFGQPSSMSSAAPSAFSFAKPPGASDASKAAASSIFGKPSGQSDESSSQPATPSIFGKPSGQAEASASQPSAPSIFGKPSGQAETSASQPPALSVFGRPSGQAEASASHPSASSIFGKPSTLSEASQPAAPSVFGKPGGQAGSSASQPPAHPIFGKPSGQAEASASQSTAPSIFGKPSGQSEASKSMPAAPSIFGMPSGQSEAPTLQPKPAFAFSFGNNSTPTSTPNANPFNTIQGPSPVPSTSAQAAPAAPNNFFGFGQPSSTTSSGTSAFGFPNKPAAEGEKK